MPHHRGMISLGIDCATKAGWALVEQINGRERLNGHGVLRLDGKHGVPAQLIADLAAEWHADFVGIEIPYVAKNVNTAMVLARLAGRFEQAFERAGSQVVVVRASEWQAGVLGRFGGVRRAEKKKAAALWARAMFGRSLTEDEADAAGIAVHVLRQFGIRSVVARAQKALAS